MQIKKLVLCILIISIPVSTVNSQSRKVKKAIKKSEKAIESNEGDYDKNRKEALKHRYNIQSREVQKRMKESKKRADHYNKAKTDPFFKDLFTRKKRNKKNRKR